MRVVIAGGAGFLGSHLSHRLVERGDQVVCVDNLVTGTLANVAGLMSHRGFIFQRGDVSDGVDVAGPVDLVLNFASPASPPDYLRLPVETLRVGSMGTMHLLELAERKRARFVMASTSEVYGDPHVHPQTEDYWGNVNPVGPRGVYDEAKRFSEAATLAYRNDRGVDAGIIRIFNTFGPRMRPEDGRAIPNFIGQALRGDPVTVAGDGQQTRSLCYVDDLVDGVLRMGSADAEGPVNLGNPHEITILDLARWIIELTGSTSEIVHVPRPTDDPFVRRPDITRAGQLLGWEPRVPVEEGLRRTIAWFRQHPRVSDVTTA